jgi:hypothetical protein
MFLIWAKEPQVYGAISKKKIRLITGKFDGGMFLGIPDKVVIGPFC